MSLTTRGAFWKWWVCGLLLLATMLNYMDRMTLNQMSVRIMDEFQLGEFEYGQLEKYFGWAFALGAIFFGWAVDRWNIRTLYPLVVVAWSVAGLATGLADTFVALVVCRFGLGLAEGGHWPCALRTTQHILPPSERPMGNSLLQSGAALGAIFTPLIIIGLIQLTGSWRYPFIAIGVIGVGWVFFWLASVRREDLCIAHTKSAASLTSVLTVLLPLLIVDIVVHVLAPNADWLPLFTTGLILAAMAWVFYWLIASTRDDTRLPRRAFVQRFCVLVVLVITVNVTWHYFRAWLPPFLQKVHKYEELPTQWFMSAYYAIADVGTLLAGYVTLRLAQRGFPLHGSRLLVFACCALLTTLSVAVAFLEAGWLLLGLLLVIGFAALGLFPNYYSFSQEITVQYQGKVTGSLGCINWLAMSLLHELVGDSIKRTGSYSQAMALAGLAPLLGLLALLLFWGKTAPRSEDSEKTSLPSEEQKASVAV